MLLIKEKTRRNIWLYVLNTAMVVVISSTVLALSMPVSAGLILLLLDNGKITKCAELMPEFMQPIGIEGLECMTPEINFIFWASLILAIAITAVTIYMLCKLQANSKEIGENNRQSRIVKSLNQEEGQTISLCQINGEAVTDEDKNYVILDKIYPYGSQVKIEGVKIITLGKMTKGQNGKYEYEVSKYENTTEPEIKTEGVQNDCFEKNFTISDATVYSTGPNTLSTILSKVHQEQPKGKNRGTD